MQARFSMIDMSFIRCCVPGMQIAAAVVTFSIISAVPAVVVAQALQPPPTWSVETHSDEAVPDYDRLFSMDRVHELHIKIDTSDFEAMRDDLQSLGPAGMPGFSAGGPPGGGFGGLADALERFSAAAGVCENQAPQSACTIDGTDGRCTAIMGENLVCVPEAMVALMADGEAVGPGGPVRIRRVGGPGGFGGQVPDLIDGDPIYVPVSVSHDGRVWTGVGMRYKGNSSLMTASMSGNGKVPFRLDFDRYEDEMPEIGNQRFYGFHKLTFSSNFSDDSMLKEVLATELFRDRGVPAARAAFYRVFVDVGSGEEYWGLYTMIEDPADGAMLDAQFGGRGGNLYKPDGPGANWSLFDAEGFDKKTNEKAEDYSDVIAAIDALHAPQDNPAVWRQALEARFDVDLFLRWLAVNTVMENWDSYGRLAHNYYVYGDPADAGRLKWISWDHNMSFGMAGGGGFPRMGGRGFGGNGRGGRGGIQPPPGFENVVRDGAAAFFSTLGGDDVLHAEAGASWPLISRVLADEIYAAQYRAELELALGGLFAPEAFEARARELHTLITPFAIGPQGERATHTTLSSASGFMQALDGPNGLLARVDARREKVRAALAGR